MHANFIWAEMLWLFEMIIAQLYGFLILKLYGILLVINTNEYPLCSSSETEFRIVITLVREQNTEHVLKK